ncbi:MAG: efflux RND transporter periplasmic adaptor subunit [Deltaproteobacteria bacterium]|jgi:cobalt-zinc-cadmium efflux system membrane fusion protein|nr:efflux RND transporter periplasmic adaptor subunit [Deltaproteobacteria bacterium]MBW2533244.1 efflux RND transporter periplasmic adaptor subunit [Deltaproteobacteria bacterium]
MISGIDHQHHSTLPSAGSARRRRRSWAAAVSAFALLTAAACSKTGGQPPGHDHRDHNDAEGEETSDGHEHGHGHGEGSDLDRPVGELFAATCEHGVKTHECAECRYEVGVVKAPSHLFDGGLLETAKAEKRPIKKPLRLTGEVEFDQRRVAHVSTQAEGLIGKVHVTLGDEVESGQALLEVDSVEAGDAQAAYLEAKAELALAKRNYERIAALRDEGISSEKALFRAKQELDSAKIRANAAGGKLSRLGMASAAGRLVLRAPVDGTVLDMHAVAGEVARTGEHLVTVGDNAALWVWADLYERDIAAVTRAQRNTPLEAEIQVKAFPDRTFPGVVDFISPAMSESSRTVKVRIAVPNQGRELLAGMFAKVDLFLPEEGEVLSIPNRSVVEDEKRSFVFVHHQEDYYVRRPVTVGRRFAGWAEVIKGLSGEETIVADGAFLLKSDVLRSKMGAGCAD